MNYKTLSLGLVTATMLATPVMAQGVYQEPGAFIRAHYPTTIRTPAMSRAATVSESDAPGLATITATGFTRRHASVRLRQRLGMTAPHSIPPTAPMASLSASGDAL